MGINSALLKKSHAGHRLAKKLFQMLPERNELLYRICKRYVDRYNGDNNSDFYTNGEYVFMIEQLRHSTVVFDIGANVGEWAKAALSVKPNIKLHCFEPSLPTFEQLQSNNFPSNVKLNRLGLSSTPGHLVLQIANEGSGLNSLYIRRGIFENKLVGTEEIPVDTVDNYCVAHNIGQIDFVKVDVEGHELEVFKGMRNMLQRACHAGGVRVIQFEYGGCNLDARVFLADIWDFFSELNYSFYKLYPNGPMHVQKYDQRFETFLYSNWAIIQNS
jgi:FkbM family methyltransferase